METLKATRAEAAAAGDKYYFNGKPCPKGHVAKRGTGSGGCYECTLGHTRRFNKRLREEHPEKIKEQREKHYASRKEHIKARANRYYHLDPEARREAARQYAAEHREEAKARASKWAKENRERRYLVGKAYRKANPVKTKSASRHAEYRAARLNATPPWLAKEDRDKMIEFYRAARQLSEATGIEHQVDHIVPLQGKTVCGLHVFWNLRILTADENNRRPRVWPVE